MDLNGRVVAHIVYEGGQDRAIGALPDIDGNGLAEILVATGETNQGVTWETISIIELAGSEITEWRLPGFHSLFEWRLHLPRVFGFEIGRRRPGG
jgi:hypothetical protein